MLCVCSTTRCRISRRPSPRSSIRGGCSVAVRTIAISVISAIVFIAIVIAVVTVAVASTTRRTSVTAIGIGIAVAIPVAMDTFAHKCPRCAFGFVASQAQLHFKLLAASALKVSLKVLRVRRFQFWSGLNLASAAAFETMTASI